MPTSTWVHVSDAMGIVIESRAKSLVDVGCGWGRFGLLFRDMLDVIKGRWTKEQWKARIDAVEPTLTYISPVHRHIYDNIYQMSAQEWLKQSTEEYEIVWCGDMLEHLPQTETMEVAMKLRERATKFFIAGVPMGDRWPQGAINGNKWERHQSVWTEQMIRQISHAYKVYPMGNRCYGLFVAEVGGKKAKFPNALRV